MAGSSFCRDLGAPKSGLALQNGDTQPPYVIFWGDLFIHLSTCPSLNIFYYCACRSSYPCLSLPCLQFLFKHPTPAIVFETATKSTRLAHFCKGAESIARAASVKVQNPLRVPLPRPQAVRTWCAFHILALKCASRDNSMSFFDISTSKSGPRPSVFNKLHFETSFPPQRSARFQHLRLQKCSEHGAPGALLLRNALRVTTACTFHTTLRCFKLFEFQISFAPQRRAIFDLSSPQMAPHLRFSEPTCRPSLKHKTLRKRCVLRLLYLFARLHLSFFCDSFSSLIFFLFFISVLWLFPPLLLHLPILSEVWLRSAIAKYCYMVSYEW